MKVESIKLVAKLKALEAKASREGRPSVAVGYNRAGALALHEMMPKNRGKPRRSGIGVYWGPAGGPKFLEAPARQLSRDIARTVRDAYAKGAELLQALYLGGLLLQRESMRRVPVEYGDLRRSAFTERER